MRRGDEGFSITELLVAASLMSVIMTAAFAVLFSGVKAQGYGAEFAHAQQKATVAMQKVTHDLRLAGRGCATDTVFLYAGRDSVSFLATAPRETLPEVITYCLREDPSGAGIRTLIRRVGEDSIGQTIAVRITAFALDYLDADGNSLLDGSASQPVVRTYPYPADMNRNGIDDILEIRRVCVLISTRTRIPRKNVYGTCELKSEVVPRNLSAQAGES